MTFEPLIPVGFIAGFTLFGLILIGLFAKHNPERRKRWLFRGLYVVLFGILVLRPGVVTVQPENVYVTQYDVYFAVDSTASMVAEDWEPGTEKTRMDGVRQDIHNLLLNYAGAKFSVIKFDSKEATTVAPLTQDSTSVMTAVNTLSTELTRNSTGSDPATGSQTVTNIIKTNKEKFPDRATVLFYFGDGEKTSAGEADNSSYPELKSVLATAVVYGYGTEEGGKMKYQKGYYISRDDGYIVNNSTGEVGVSVIDEVALKNLATDLGGSYVHRTADTPLVPVDLEDKLASDRVSEMQVFVDYSWVVAVLLLVLLATEVGYVVSVIRRTGGDLDA